jgi:type IV fimbrial biogenesis protein FimT
MKRPSVLPGHAHGFTLIELMVVVALVAVLGAIAVPNVRDLLLNQRLAASTSDFVAALSLARNEALKRAQTVTLSPSVGKDWSAGWDVKTSIGSASQTLRSFEPLRTGVTIDAGLSSIGGTVNYDGNGFALGSAGCLALKAETGRRSAIVISFSGRPKVCDPGKKGDCGDNKCAAGA